MAKKSEPGPPRLQTLHARLLIHIHLNGEPESYRTLGKALDVHERSVKRVADEMIDAGWLTSERVHRHLQFTINTDAVTKEGGTLGDWLTANTASDD